MSGWEDTSEKDFTRPQRPFPPQSSTDNGREGLVSEDSLDVTINPVPFAGVGDGTGGGCFIQTTMD
jgi:hypothetical protein